RIAIMATFGYVKAGAFDETLRLADVLLSDPHDLIHKAVGWMLREVGKRTGRRPRRSCGPATAGCRARCFDTRSRSSRRLCVGSTCGVKSGLSGKGWMLSFSM